MAFNLDDIAAWVREALATIPELDVYPEPPETPPMAEDAFPWAVAYVGPTEYSYRTFDGALMETGLVLADVYAGLGPTPSAYALLRPLITECKDAIFAHAQLGGSSNPWILSLLATPLQVEYASREEFLYGVRFELRMES